MQSLNIKDQATINDIAIQSYIKAKEMLLGTMMANDLNNLIKTKEVCDFMNEVKDNHQQLFTYIDNSHPEILLLRMFDKVNGDWRCLDSRFLKYNIDELAGIEAEQFLSRLAAYNIMATIKKFFVDNYKGVIAPGSIRVYPGTIRYLLVAPKLGSTVNKDAIISIEIIIPSIDNFLDFKSTWKTANYKGNVSFIDQKDSKQFINTPNNLTKDIVKYILGIYSNKANENLEYNQLTEEYVSEEQMRKLINNELFLNLSVIGLKDLIDCTEILINIYNKTKIGVALIKAAEMLAEIDKRGFKSTRVANLKQQLANLRASGVISQQINDEWDDIAHRLLVQIKTNIASSSQYQKLNNATVQAFCNKYSVNFDDFTFTPSNSLILSEIFTLYFNNGDHYKPTPEGEAMIKKMPESILASCLTQRFYSRLAVLNAIATLGQFFNSNLARDNSYAKKDVVESVQCTLYSYNNSSYNNISIKLNLNEFKEKVNLSSKLNLDMSSLAKSYIYIWIPPVSTFDYSTVPSWKDIIYRAAIIIDGGRNNIFEAKSTIDIIIKDIINFLKIHFK